ncbi:MAG: DUF4203 domain-containing protein [Myxococcota bacterium]
MEWMYPQPFFHQLRSTIEQATQGHESLFLLMILVTTLCGIVYTFWGYKVYPWVLRIAGMLLGAALGTAFVQALSTRTQPADPVRFQLAVCIIFGMICAFFAPKLLRFFSFLIGGTALSLTIHPLSPLLPPHYLWLILIFVFAAGGTLALFLIRPAIIFATSIAGSYFLAFSCFSLAVHMSVLQRSFNFLLFLIFWATLAVFGLTSQLQQKTPKTLQPFLGA